MKVCHPFADHYVAYQPALQDVHHSRTSPSLAWPAWLDTVGLDEGDAQDTNCQLVRQYLRALQVGEPGFLCLPDRLICLIRIDQAGRFA